MLSRLPVRALVLPALAVLVPSAFIVVLASQWLTLEQETTRLRSNESAAFALARLQSDLLSAIADEADRAAREAHTPSLLHDLVLFDDAGRTRETTVGLRCLLMGSTSPMPTTGEAESQ